MNQKDISITKHFLLFQRVSWLDFIENSNDFLINPMKLQLQKRSIFFTGGLSKENSLSLKKN